MQPPPWLGYASGLLALMTMASIAISERDSVLNRIAANEASLSQYKSDWLAEVRVMREGDLEMLRAFVGETRRRLIRLEDRVTGENLNHAEPDRSCPTNIYTQE